MAKWTVIVLFLVGWPALSQFREIHMDPSPLVIEKSGGGVLPLSALLTSYNALNITDVFLTQSILDQGGVELNPLMSEVVKNQAATLAVKTCGMLAVNYIVKVLYGWSRPAAYALAIMAVAVYAAVDLHNIRELSR